MKIAVFIQKGGVGKTNISFSLAKDLNMKYITNDTSIVASVYSNSAYYDKKIPLEDNVIYDLGGFITRYVQDILRNVDLVIIPTIADYNSMLKALDVIEFLNNNNKKHIIIANMIDNKKELYEIQSTINKTYPDTEVIEIKRTKALKFGLEHGMGFNEVFSSTALNKHVYKSISVQYKNLLKVIN